MIGRCFTGRGCSSGYVHPFLGKPDQIADQKSTPGLLLYLHLPPGPQHLQKQAIVRKHNPKLTEFIEYLLHSEYPIEKEQEIERIKAIMQELPPQCLKVFMLSTIEEEKEKKDFPFTQEGLESAIDWINQSYEAKRPFWEQKAKDRMKLLL